MLATAADVRSAIRNGDKLDSAVVSSLLSAADAAAKTYLQRTLESGTYTERVRAERVGDWMQLGEWPISSVTSIGVADSLAMEVWNSGAAKATISVNATGVLLREFYSGAWITNTFLFADYATVTLLRAAIAALPRWDATLSSEITGQEPSTDLAELSGPIDVADSKIKQLYLLDGVPVAEWDFVDGTFSFTECGTREGETVLVTYVGGYSTVPADVSKAVGMIAAEMYATDNASVGAGMRREKLGDYEGERFQDGLPTVITKSVQKLLAPYRRAIV